MTRTTGRSRLTESTFAASSLSGWRRRVAAVFQDFVRFEFSLRENVDPAREASDERLGQHSSMQARRPLPTRRPVGQGIPHRHRAVRWPVAAGCPRAGVVGVRRGAGLVLLDEPTAQLDVRGEAKVFDRVLQATREVTTILISHRFSTVRHADRICVL